MSQSSELSINKFFEKIIKKVCKYKNKYYLCIGLSKRPFWSINLLVISFSVINYVVSMSCRRDGHNSFLLYSPLLAEYESHPCYRMSEFKIECVKEQSSFGGIAV